MYEAVELSALDAKAADTSDGKPQESTGWIDVRLLTQSATPLCLSLLGLLLTSAILDRAQHWSVFVKVSELLLMVPVLLNLKGNLEMSVTGRLSVSCHMVTGKQGEDGKWWRVVRGNGLILVAQSAVCSTIVGGLSVLIGFLVIHRGDHTFGMWRESVMVMACPVAACMLSAAVNYVVLVTVIWWAGKAGMDPDNVATPIAAALGDLTAVGCLCVFAVILDGRWLLSLLTILLTLAIFAFAITSMAEEEYELMLSGWIPIIIGLLVTMVAGMILERFHEALANLPIMLPIVNGISGGLLSIYACRLASAYLVGGDLPIKTPLTIAILTVPLNVIVFTCIKTFRMGHRLFGVKSLVLHGFALMAQVIAVLFLGQQMVRVCVSRQWDAATVSLPILTAFSDLLGTVLLIAVGFALLVVHK